MLSGSQLGKARQQTRLVADRIKYNLGNRPLGLVWSKSDITIDAEVKHQISGHIQNSTIEHYSEFQTSVRNTDTQTFHANILETIRWIISVLDAQVNVIPKIKRYASEDLFLSKR